MAQSTVTKAPLYTGNNVLIRINNQIVGFVQTLSVTRNVNRRPVYQVGSPLWVDAPVTQASVTVTATNLVPIPGKSNAQTMAQAGITPNASLVNQVLAGTYDIDVVDANSGKIVYSILDAYYNQDAAQVPGTDVLTVNCSWVARDTKSWI